MLGKTNSGGGGFDPSDIQSGTIAVDNILGLSSLGDIVKGNLSGQYVRVIPAPASTTLTDELIEVFKEGVFVNGTFLSMKNPVFFPCEKDANDYYRGIAFGVEYAGRDTVIYTYEIYKSTKYIQKGYGVFRVKNSSGLVSLTGNLQIGAKTFPNYPTSNTTPKVLQIASNGGSLSWGDVPSPAVIAYEGTSLLPTDVVFEDWTLHRAIKDGNILWFVLAGKITNNGTNASVTDILEITLPSEISSKIYRADGTTCDQAYSGGSAVITFYDIFNNTSTKFLLISPEANKIKIKIASAQTLATGGSQMLNTSIPIFLDTGTVS